MPQPIRCANRTLTAGATAINTPHTMHYAIIAAGEGSRLRAEGIDTPKPLVKLGDTTLIGRLIAIMRRQPDCERISVIVTPAVHDRVTATGVPSPWAAADDVIVASTPGSMHSLHRLAPCLRGADRFCLTTVDTVFSPGEFDSFTRAVRHSAGADGYMGVTTYIDDEKPLYISADSDGWITGYFDTPLPDTRYVSGGIYALPASSLDVLDDCMAAGMVRMRDFQRALVASGMRLRAYPFGRIIDIDHAADIDRALELTADETTVNS